MEVANGLQAMSIHNSKANIVLNDLPTEIQDLIFHYVVEDSSREELKQFRQSNRYFRDRADIHLFRTLHISASNLSLERIRHIAENDRLNVHVRELVFHRGTFSGHKMVKFAAGSHTQPRDYDDFETYVVRSHMNSTNMMRISKCYEAFKEELEAESAFNREMSWRALMRKYCSRFSKLDSLTTCSDASDLFSSYMVKRFGFTYQTTTPNYFAPYEIFEACGPQFRPRALTFNSVNGEDFGSIMSFHRGGPKAIKEIFANLKSFRLSFSETVTSLELDGTYDVFVPACINLRTLSLDFTSFYSPKMLKDPESFPQKLIKLFLQQRFLKLAHLDLKYALMTEHDFISFLQSHRDTLVTLKLTRWPMPTDTSGQPAGSIIRTFYKMGQLGMSKLQSIELEGEFSNRADGEGWTVYNDPGYDRPKTPWPTLSRLMQYLEGGGFKGYEFPFPISEKVMTEAQTGKQLAELDEMPAKMGFSDTTFEWWDGR